MREKLSLPNNTIGFYTSFAPVDLNQLKAIYEIEYSLSEFETFLVFRILLSMVDTTKNVFPAQMRDILINWTSDLCRQRFSSWQDLEGFLSDTRKSLIEHISNRLSRKTPHIEWQSQLNVQNFLSYFPEYRRSIINDFPDISTIYLLIDGIDYLDDLARSLTLFLAKENLDVFCLKLAGRRIPLSLINEMGGPSEFLRNVDLVIFDYEPTDQVYYDYLKKIANKRLILFDRTKGITIGDILEDDNFYKIAKFSGGNVVLFLQIMHEIWENAKKENAFEDMSFEDELLETTLFSFSIWRFSYEHKESGDLLPDGRVPIVCARRLVYNLSKIEFDDQQGALGIEFQEIPSYEETKIIRAGIDGGLIVCDKVEHERCLINSEYCPTRIYISPTLWSYLGLKGNEILVKAGDLIKENSFDKLTKMHYPGDEEARKRSRYRPSEGLPLFEDLEEEHRFFFVSRSSKLFHKKAMRQIVRSSKRWNRENPMEEYQALDPIASSRITGQFPRVIAEKINNSDFVIHIIMNKYSETKEVIEEVIYEIGLAIGYKKIIYLYWDETDNFPFDPKELPFYLRKYQVTRWNNEKKSEYKSHIRFYKNEIINDRETIKSVNYPCPILGREEVCPFSDKINKMEIRRGISIFFPAHLQKEKEYVHKKIRESNVREVRLIPIEADAPDLAAEVCFMIETSAGLICDVSESPTCEGAFLLGIGHSKNIATMMTYKETGEDRITMYDGLRQGWSKDSPWEDLDTAVERLIKKIVVEKGHDSLY